MDSITNYAPAIGTLARTITARFRAGELAFTIDWQGRDVAPRNAYVVGGVGPSLVFPGYINPEEGTLKIAQWLANNWSHKAYAPIGAWLETEEGEPTRVYLDTVTVLPIDSGFKNAVGIAQARGELALGEFNALGEYSTTHFINDALAKLGA